MERYQGKSIAWGIAEGKIFPYVKDRYQVEKIRKKDPEGEIERYRRTEEEAIRQLEKPMTRRGDCGRQKRVTV